MPPSDTVLPDAVQHDAPQRDGVHYYAALDIEVSYDPRRCIHAARCLKGLPAVFDEKRHPWIIPSEALPNDIARVVELCPSGALHYRRLDGAVQEEAGEPTTITTRHNGPLYVRGNIELHAADGTLIVEDTRMALCRCGASNNKPFCDNSHRRIGFQDGTDVIARDSHEEHGA